MAYYHCSECGSPLDAGEKCDCQLLLEADRLIKENPRGTFIQYINGMPLYEKNGVLKVYV